MTLVVRAWLKLGPIMRKKNLKWSRRCEGGGGGGGFNPAIHEVFQSTLDI